MDALKQLLTYVLSLIILCSIPFIQGMLLCLKLHNLLTNYNLGIGLKKNTRVFFTRFDPILQELTCTYSITAYKHAYTQTWSNN